jgi:hypothetical protein
MSSTVAQLFEHSSRETPDGNADPYLLLLRTLDVQTPDIANITLKIGELRTLAKNVDPRLAVLLMEDVKTFIESLTSLTSVGGKGLKYLTTQTQAYHITERTPSPKMGLRDMIDGKQLQKDQPGIPIDRD